MNDFTLFAVDDRQERLDHASNAARAHDATLISYRPNGEDSFIGFETALNAINGDVAVILDLGFRRKAATDPLWPAVVKQLERLCSTIPDAMLASGRLIFRTDGRTYTIGPQFLDGIALFPVLAEYSRRHRVLIVIATGRGEYLPELRRLLSLLNNQTAGYGRHLHLELDCDNRSLGAPEHADGIVSDMPAVWKRAFPYFHSRQWVDRVISDWLSTYRAFGDERPLFCQHGHIEANADKYRALIVRLFGEPAGVANVQELKALFQLDVNVAADVKPSQWFHSWRAISPVPRWRILSSALVRTLIHAATGVDIVVECNIRMPTCPALPFFAALNVLVHELTADHGGMLASQPLSIVGRKEGPFRISLPLRQSTKHEFALAERWVEKCLNGRKDLERKGVVHALWATSLGAVSINRDTVTDGAEQALLGLFDGPGRPVVGVAFAPHYIHLYWH